MTDPTTTPIEVDPSQLGAQAKAQLRILLAAIAGALVGKHILPAGIINDTLLDAITALVFVGVASGWQAFRTWLQHTRLWTLAVNPRVPDDLVRPTSNTGA